MNRIQILDCTLRDGGYCNDWKFGYKNTKKIITGLVDAGVEIIECGFITNKTVYDKEITKFTTVEQLANVIPENRRGKMFVAMMNYGEYDVEDLPEYNGKSIDGVRVAFHKSDIEGAIRICKVIKRKGYKVFVQPMVSLSYSDEEFMKLIYLANEFEPYAFYIVDSFGMMKNKDLIRLFYLVEHNLRTSICIGFHSHNNMQLAFSNAQSLVSIQTNRDLIIDSSVYGMGRGAGNLNTELFVDYLNDFLAKKYVLKPLLTIIDDILNGFYQQNYWGYSLPNYLSAANNTHPSYASYLDDKNTLTVEAMSEIFEMMDDSKRNEFDKTYIEELYLRYMEAGVVQKERCKELRENICGRKLLLIAPGRSAVEEKHNIGLFINEEDPLVVGVNSEYLYADTNFIFLSNLRRFRELSLEKKDKCIVTSNIAADGVYMQTSYKELINNVEAVEDNAGLMAIKFFIDLGIKEIYLAGFDGYSHESKENYADDYTTYITQVAILDAMNAGMELVLKEYSEKANIKFITKPKYIHI